MVELAASTVTMLLVSLAVGGLLVRYGAKDAPDGVRKLQARPVATSGGVAILAGAAAGILTLIGLVPESVVIWSWLGDGFKVGLVLSLAMFALGLCDDIFNISARLKLTVIAVACLGASLLGLHVTEIPYWSGTLILPVWLGIAGSALWLFVVINIVNFMDGANGLMVGSFVAIISAVCLFQGPSVLIIAAPLVGFLFWNLQGKLYAGDAGALVLGAAFAALALSDITNNTSSAWAWALVLLPFFVDTLLTLIWRWRHGRDLMTAHREHAYQLQIRLGTPHISASIAYWTLMIICTFTAIRASGVSDAATFYAFWTLTAALSLIWYLHRRYAWPRVVAQAALNTPG